MTTEEVLLRLHIKVLVLTLSLTIAGSAFGSGYSLFEQGAKATAMGGAFAATADDPSAIFYNVAGIAQQRRLTILAGATFITFANQFTGDPNDEFTSGQSGQYHRHAFVPPNAYVTGRKSIVVVSTVDDEPKARSLGADAYCSKPIDRQGLLQVLTRLVTPEAIKKILIVDDEEICRYVLRQHLISPHHVVREARSEGAVHRTFQNLTLDSLAIDKQTSTLAGLGPARAWITPEWRGRTLALR